MTILVDTLNRPFPAVKKTGLAITKYGSRVSEGKLSMGYTLSLASTAFTASDVVAAIASNKPFSLNYLNVSMQPRTSPPAAGFFQCALYRLPLFTFSNAAQPTFRYEDSALTATLVVPSGAGVLGSLSPLNPPSGAYASYEFVAQPVLVPQPQPGPIFISTAESRQLFCPTTEVLALVVTLNSLPAINFSLDVNYQIQTYVAGTTEE